MNLDMGIVAALTAGCSVFGLPWLVAATVRSLAHVKSLTKYEQLGWGQERIAGVAEQRYVSYGDVRPMRFALEQQWCRRYKESRCQRLIASKS